MEGGSRQRQGEWQVEGRSRQGTLIQGPDPTTDPSSSHTSIPWPDHPFSIRSLTSLPSLETVTLSCLCFLTTHLSLLLCNLAPAYAHSRNLSLNKLQTLNRMAFGLHYSWPFCSIQLVTPPACKCLLLCLASFPVSTHLNLVSFCFIDIKEGHICQVPAPGMWLPASPPFSLCWSLLFLLRPRVQPSLCLL